jgi:hypothetical protein
VVEFTVSIFLSRKTDVELLLGPTICNKKYSSDNVFSEIVISALYPTKLKFNTRDESLEIEIFYVSKIEQFSPQFNDIIPIDVFPTAERTRSEKKSLELKKRDKKRSFLGIVSI